MPPQKQLNIAGVANVAVRLLLPLPLSLPYYLLPLPTAGVIHDTIGICYRRLAGCCSQMRSNWRYIWPQKMQRALRDRSLCEIWAQESDKPPVSKCSAQVAQAQTTGLSRTLDDKPQTVQDNPSQSTPRHATPRQSNRNETKRIVSNPLQERQATAEIVSRRRQVAAANSNSNSQFD